MEVLSVFMDTHRQLLPLFPPRDMDDLRQRMVRAAALGRAFVEANVQSNELHHVIGALHTQKVNERWSDDTTTAICERAAFLLEAVTTTVRQRKGKSSARTIYGAALQHELIRLALCEDEVWRAFRDGVWYVRSRGVDYAQERGALRAARTAASLMHEGAGVFLPTIAEDVYDAIDLFALLEVDGRPRGFAIQVGGGQHERILHLDSAPPRENFEKWRLWQGCVKTERRYGFPWIPTLVEVAYDATKAGAVS